MVSCTKCLFNSNFGVRTYTRTYINVALIPPTPTPLETLKFFATIRRDGHWSDAPGVYLTESQQLVNL